MIICKFCRISSCQTIFWNSRNYYGFRVFTMGGERWWVLGGGRGSGESTMEGVRYSNHCEDATVQGTKHGPARYTLASRFQTKPEKRQIGICFADVTLSTAISFDRRRCVQMYRTAGWVVFYPVCDLPIPFLKSLFWRSSPSVGSKGGSSTLALFPVTAAALLNLFGLDS